MSQSMALAFRGIVRYASTFACVGFFALGAPTVQAGFANIGFETGTPNAAPPTPWVLSTFKNPLDTGIPFYPPQTIGDLGLVSGGTSNTVIVQSTSGPASQSDEALGTNGQFRWPLYGNQSAIVNGPESSAINTTGAFENVNVLTQTATIVPSDVDPIDGQIHIRFFVAPVIQYGGHAPAAEAYTFVEVTNLTQNTQLFHAFYNFDYDSYDPWKSLNLSGQMFYYTGWQTIDVAPGSPNLNMGDNVMVRLVAAGCALGSHEAHLYVDGAAFGSRGLWLSGSGPARVDSPGTVTYSVNFGNDATSSQTGVGVEITTPPGLTFASLVVPGSTCTIPPVGTAGTASCFIPSLPAGALLTAHITFNVPTATSSPIHFRNYSIGSNSQPPILGPPVDTNVFATTTTTLSSNNNPSTIGQSVIFTATVSGQTPTGSVTFSDGATTLCSAVTLSSGMATCMSSTLSAGSHSITATYGGDSSNDTSTSAPLTQQVNLNNTVTSLSTSCMTTFVENQPFTMTAGVSGSSPSGSVTFATQDNLVLCGNVTLSAGSASCTSSALTAGSSASGQMYDLTAAYSGDGTNASSVSAPIAVTVLSAGDVVFRNGYEAESASCPIE